MFLESVPSALIITYGDVLVDGFGVALLHPDGELVGDVIHRDDDPGARHLALPEPVGSVSELQVQVVSLGTSVIVETWRL